MKEIHIITLEDTEGMLSDVVALSSRKHAQQIERKLVAHFGRQRVTVISMTVDNLPEFWGMGGEEYVLPSR